mmetsp:Transcript_63862/g.177563  ORF Transcript_63862/g.177563 Transcript_63862/m.177563 type:complete len:220 (-) Transcript_63862:740-1399(-)
MEMWTACGSGVGPLSSPSGSWYSSFLVCGASAGCFVTVGCFSRLPVLRWTHPWQTVGGATTASGDGGALRRPRPARTVPWAGGALWGGGYFPSRMVRDGAAAGGGRVGLAANNGRQPATGDRLLHGAGRQGSRLHGEALTLPGWRRICRGRVVAQNLMFHVRPVCYTGMTRYGRGPHELHGEVDDYVPVGRGRGGMDGDAARGVPRTTMEPIWGTRTMS